MTYIVKLEPKLGKAVDVKRVSIVGKNCVVGATSCDVADGGSWMEIVIEHIRASVLARCC